MEGEERWREGRCGGGGGRERLREGRGEVREMRGVWRGEMNVSRGEVEGEI